MCDICLSTPCDRRCPNAPEPRVVHTCLKCHTDIVEGDGFYDIDGEIWCEDCINDCHDYAEVEDEGY